MRDRCSADHLCVVCWVKERCITIHRLLFRLLPVRWRHRITMREAMRRRRQWQRLKREGSALALLIDPRSAHLHRRLLRNLMHQLARPPLDDVDVEWKEC